MAAALFPFDLLPSNCRTPSCRGTAPRRRKVRSAPFPPAAKTLSAPFPAPLPTVRGTAGPPGTELGDGKKQDRRSGPACVSGSAYFKLKNAFMPGYSATSPRPRKVRSAPFPPAAKTLPAPFPAPLPTVRGTAGPPGMEPGDGKKQDRRSGPACVSGSAYFKLKNAFIPGYSATSPSSSSMRSS